MGDVTREQVLRWLEAVVEAYPDRHVGGPGNLAATRLFSAEMRGLGYEVETAELPCLDWERGASSLEAGGETFPLHPGPYSPPCEAVAPLAAAGTVEDLEAGRFAGRVLLVHGDLVREQLIAKNFVFYNPDEHKRIVAALESSGAVAIVAATGRNPGLAGGAYPFPLVEDGDFTLPTAYLTDVEGERLLAHAGGDVTLRIDSRRVFATCEQPVARKRGTGAGRLLAVAHVDSKDGTPGALDNGTGVAVLLGLAGLLAGEELRHTLEIVPFNGEDYYAVTGQMHWLAENDGRMGDVVLAMNVDGAGFAGHGTEVSLYGCPEDVASVVRERIALHGFAEGPQWPQGDHMMLAMHGIPAVAVTSADAFFVASTVAHTPADTLENVDPEAVAEVSRFFADVVRELDAG